MADRVGQRLDNYRLTRLLGTGGFGEVYLAEHLYHSAQVAIKLLPQLAQDDLHSFLMEARTFRLKHPNIVQVLDFGVEGRLPFIVMEYAPNGTLRQRHPKGSRVMLLTIVSYVKQVASALQYAHEDRLVHRDVKPENILIGEQNQILLSDFGIATIAHGTSSLRVEKMSGTISYMAPEQIQGNPRPASDQYSLGVVVYEWLCGYRPFHGTLTEVAAQHVTISPPPLHEKVMTISPDVEQVVMTALAKDPKQRFSSVLAFASALEQASQGKQPEPVVPLLETTGTHRYRQPTEMVMPVPIIPLSLQAVSEVPEATQNQLKSLLALTDMERLRHVAQERQRIEEESVLQEKKQADNSEEKGVRKENQIAVVNSVMASEAQRNPLLIQMTHSSQSQALRPETMGPLKPDIPVASRRFILLVLATMVIVTLISGISWLTAYHQSPAEGTLATPTGGINHAFPVGHITEFHVPTAGSSLLGITLGPDGNLWFTEYGGNKIGRISPSGKITEFPIPISMAPSLLVGITAGPDHNLWFTEFKGDKIGRISPSGKITEFSVLTSTARGDPWGITSGPDGNLWFTESITDKIGRISPSGKITEFSIPTSQSYPLGITAGPDGNLWFTESGGNKIGRISPSGKITEFSIPTSQSGAAEITPLPDGNLWFTENGGNKIGRIRAGK